MERIIPILTGVDNRLSTTITLISGSEAWKGFDDNTGTLFHSAEFATTGDIVWHGDIAYRLNLLQFICQESYWYRLPKSIVLYGSNNNGENWTSLYAAETEFDQTQRSINAETAYKSFKLSILSNCGANYTTFSEMLLTGVAAIPIPVSASPTCAKALTLNPMRSIVLPITWQRRRAR